MIWDNGGADYVQKKLPNTNFIKTVFTGLDLYLSSENAGLGSDRATHVRADLVKYLNNYTKNFIDNKTLFLISSHKF